MNLFRGERNERKQHTYRSHRSLASNHLSKRGKAGKNHDLEPFQRLAMILFRERHTNSLMHFLILSMTYVEPFIKKRGKAGKKPGSRPVPVETTANNPVPVETTATISYGLLNTLLKKASFLHKYHIYKSIIFINVSFYKSIIFIKASFYKSIIFIKVSFFIK